MIVTAVVWGLAVYGVFELWMRVCEWAGGVQRRREDVRAVRRQRELAAALRGPRVLRTRGERLRRVLADELVLDDMGVGRPVE